MPAGDEAQDREPEGNGSQDEAPEPDPSASRSVDDLIAEALAEIDAAVESVSSGPGRVEQLEELPPERDIALREQEQDVELKGKYGRRLLSMMILQLGIADAVFIAYAWAGKDWNVPTAAIHVWLGATLVEVIGVVYVVTRYLFPVRDA